LHEKTATDCRQDAEDGGLYFKKSIYSKFFLPYAKRAILVFLMLLAPALYPVGREEAPYLVLYGGRFTDTDLLGILTRGETDFNHSHIVVGAINYPLHSQIRTIHFEAEGQLVKHFGIMNHLEFNTVLVARWIPSILNERISVAFGEGLSIAARRPSLENSDPDWLKLKPNGDPPNQVQNYMLLELEWNPSKRGRNIKLFTRIHHRSGVYGTYCSYICGSNFIAYGTKVKL